MYDRLRPMQTCGSYFHSHLVKKKAKFSGFSNGKKVLGLQPDPGEKFSPFFPNPARPETKTKQ